MILPTACIADTDQNQADAHMHLFLPTHHPDAMERQRERPYSWPTKIVDVLHRPSA